MVGVVTPVVVFFDDLGIRIVFHEVINADQLVVARDQIGTQPQLAVVGVHVVVVSIALLLAITKVAKGIVFPVDTRVDNSDHYAFTGTRRDEALAVPYFVGPDPDRPCIGVELVHPVLFNRFDARQLRHACGFTCRHASREAVQGCPVAVHGGQIAAQHEQRLSPEFFEPRIQVTQVITRGRRIDIQLADRWPGLLSSRGSVRLQGFTGLRGLSREPFRQRLILQ